MHGPKTRRRPKEEIMDLPFPYLFRLDDEGGGDSDMGGRGVVDTKKREMVRAEEEEDGRGQSPLRMTDCSSATESL